MLHYALYLVTNSVCLPFEPEAARNCAIRVLEVNQNCQVGAEKLNSSVKLEGAADSGNNSLQVHQYECPLLTLLVDAFINKQS